MNIIEELKKLRRTHYQCPDFYYSCKKHSEWDEEMKDKERKCTCGADESNKIINKIINHLKNKDNCIEIEKHRINNEKKLLNKILDKINETLDKITDHLKNKRNI